MAQDKPDTSPPNEEAFEDFSSRLDDALDSRAQDAAPKENQSGAAMSLAIKLASELIAALLVGGLLGYGADWVFKTSPLFLLCGLALGFAAAFLSVLRMMKTLNKEGQHNASDSSQEAVQQTTKDITGNKNSTALSDSGRE